MAVNFGVNYLPVIVAAIVAVVIGFVWFSPQMLGRQWTAYTGQAPAEARPAPTAIVIGVVSALVNAWVLAVLSLNLGGTTITDGILLGVIVWLGFVATVTVADVAFQKKPRGLWVVNNGHHVIVQAVMGAIVTAWR